MADTHRSFVHMSEVVRAFNLRESEFSAAPSQWPHQARGASTFRPVSRRYERPAGRVSSRAALTELHALRAGMYNKILDDLRIAAGEQANYLLAQGVPPEEVSALEKKANTCVSPSSLFA